MGGSQGTYFQVAAAFVAKKSQTLTSFVVFRVDGLLQRGDVAESQEKENHQVPLVAYRRHLKKQP